MGQLCSCARAQDTRGRKWVNKTILSRSPSAKSACYMLNNVDVDVVGKQSPDGTAAPPNDVRPRSQQSSIEESGVFSKASSSSADDHSTASYGAGPGPGPGAGAALTQRPGLPSTALQETPQKETPKSVTTEEDRSAPNRQTTKMAARTVPAILEKSSSLDDVTMTSPVTPKGGGVTTGLDLKAAVSLQAEPGKFSGGVGGGGGSDMLTRVKEGGANRGDDLLETQAQKVRSVLQRTVELMAAEIDSASIAEYVQRSRPDLELTEAAWAECCNPATAQDLIWEVIAGQDEDNYELFLGVIGSKVHLQHLFDLLQTLDTLIALISPDIDDDDDDDDDDKDDDNDVDDEPCGTCETCRIPDSSDFDLDLVFCHRDPLTFQNPATPTISNPTDDVRGLPNALPIDCSSLSLAGGSFLPSVIGDELGQPTVPMLTLSLINHCLCRRRHSRQKAGLLRRAVDQSSCLRELSLVKTHISDEDLNLLLQAVANSSSLVRLELRLSSFGNDAAAHLGHALRHNHSIRTLNVASTGLTDVGCSRLMTGLTRNRSLSDLDIGFNDIRDAGCAAVAEALARPNPLRKVRMRDNGITCHGASALFQALARNCRLSFLDISSNGIGSDSMRHLSEALISNRTLRELNLENCRIASGGCTALARALRANTALQILQLSLNPISDVGLEALADALRYNHAVETLSVNMCNVGNLGFLRLLDMLRFNSTLTTVKLCYNNIGAAPTVTPSSESGELPSVATPSLDEVFSRLFQALHTNPKLKVLLWGNDAECTRAGRALGTGSCVGDQRSASFSNSTPQSPVLSIFRQDILVSI